jgi:arabinofuranan 3-O-arabinosyltransferase
MIRSDRQSPRRPSPTRDRRGRRRALVDHALLAAIAFVPALMSSPGRMPADTKLYLYLDPGGLVGRAGSTFETEQFAGWVPHQQIAYLWPTGPWYWTFDALGVPDWIAHRLWIATLMFAAGAGVRWAARQLGFSATAALVAALVYQLSPYLLPYISRTSSMLLPWAGLGWILGLTIRATRRRPDRRSARWRDPALVALVVATVGAVNFTAIVVLVPVPLLWLVHVVARGTTPLRDAVAFAARAGALCLATSAWWMAMLVVQSRYGAPLLDFSESLADVSRNSTGSEVLRGLGYWLFYYRDALGPATTSSLPYLVSLRQIALGYGLTLLALLSLTVVRWRDRRFAAWLVAVGALVAVGVHPIGASSPLITALTGDGDDGLALALRSSTRALPVMVLGAALALASLVGTIEQRHAARATDTRRRFAPAHLAAVAIVALVLINVPSVWRAQLVDPAIDRDQDLPVAWEEGIKRLREGDDGFRVLQLPGAEFGAFRWGYTVDQPLVGQAAPLVTRDLLPLGSAGAMDLSFALDDRIQEGWLEPDAVAPVARLLGADTIWLTNDIAFERFRTARPELLDEQLTGVSGTPGVGLGATERFGEPTPNVPDVAMVDGASLTEPAVGRPIEPVVLVGIDEPVPVVRVKDTEVVVSGSGDGLVDAAAAGLLSGDELIRYSASLGADALEDAIASADRVLITDSNRDRAHHWRGSQDVHGHTEPGGPDPDVSRPTSADQRLAVFATAEPDQQTIGEQRGPVRATASAYGEPFAYRPEDRAVHAIDGDPSTAWRVADHFEAVGERITLALDEPVTSLRVVQSPVAAGGRRIDAVEITVDGEPTTSVVVELDDTSLTEPGQTIELPTAAAEEVVLTIDRVSAEEAGTEAAYGPVGFATIDTGLAPTTEVIRLPVDATDAVGDAPTPLTWVMTRLRTDPLDRWRSDPERELVRELDVPRAVDVDAEVTLRLDRRAADEVLVSILGLDGSGVGGPGAIADRRLPGSVTSAGWAATDGDPTTAWISPFDRGFGASLMLPASPAGATAWTLQQRTGDFSTITELTFTDGATSAVVAVPEPDADGVSALTVPAELTGRPVTATVTGVDARSTTDRRFGSTVTLPVSIAGIGPVDSGLGIAPDRAREVVGGCDDRLLTLDGTPIPLSYRTTVGALLDGDPVTATVCGDLALDTGANLLRSTGRAETGLTVDRVVLSTATSETNETTATNVTGSALGAGPVSLEVDEPRRRQVIVPPCERDCWLVLGEGWNEAWSATIDGDDLGPPELVDGGFNGWRLPASSTDRVVDLEWTAQRPVDIAMAISAAAVLLAIGLVITSLFAGRGDPAARRPRIDLAFTTSSASSSRAAWVATAVSAVGAALLIQPVWGAVGLGVGMVGVLLDRVRAHRPERTAPRVFEIAGLALATAVVVAVLHTVRTQRPFPNSGWTERVDHLNGAALFALLVIAVGATLDRREAPSAERER